MEYFSYYRFLKYRRVYNFIHDNKEWVECTYYESYYINYDYNPKYTIFHIDNKLYSVDGIKKKGSLVTDFITGCCRVTINDHKMYLYKNEN